MHPALGIGWLAEKNAARLCASNAETRAPFRATRTQDCATAAGFHAHPKTMRAFAPGGRRLIGPFHDLCLSWCEKPAITTVNECFCQSDSAPLNRREMSPGLWIT